MYQFFLLRYLISSLSFKDAVGEFIFLKKRVNCKKNVYEGGMKLETRQVCGRPY